MDEKWGDECSIRVVLWGVWSRSVCGCRGGLCRRWTINVLIVVINIHHCFRVVRLPRFLELVRQLQRFGEWNLCCGCPCHLRQIPLVRGVESWLVRNRESRDRVVVESHQGVIKLASCTILADSIRTVERADVITLCDQTKKETRKAVRNWSRRMKSKQNMLFSYLLVSEEAPRVQ